MWHVRVNEISARCLHSETRPPSNEPAVMRHKKGCVPDRLARSGSVSNSDWDGANGNSSETTNQKPSCTWRLSIRCHGGTSPCGPWPSTKKNKTLRRTAKLPPPFRKFAITLQLMSNRCRSRVDDESHHVQPRDAHQSLRCLAPVMTSAKLRVRPRRPQPVCQRRLFPAPPSRQPGCGRRELVAMA